MDNIAVRKSKLATTSLVFVVISYLVIFIPILLLYSGLVTLWWRFIFSTILGFILNLSGFVLSILALMFIRKHNLLGKKIAIVSLVSSILLLVLFYGLINFASGPL